MTESLIYLIKSVWEGRSAAVQAERDLTNVGKAGENSEQGLKKGQQGLSGFDSTLKGLLTGGALLAVGKQLLEIGQMSIEAASDVEEADAKFGVVFSESGPRVRAELDAFAKTVGRNKFELMEYAATLGDTLKPMGMNESAAADFSVQLVKLATDLSSFNNMPMDEALRRLQGTLIGSHENALAFGVVINENTLKAELAANGWDKLSGAQLEQAKVQARINLLMAGTVDAQGDAARTADGYANVTRDLEAATQELAVAFGQNLLPAMTRVKAESADVVRGLTQTLEINNALRQAVEDGVLTNQEMLLIQGEMRHSTEAQAEAQEMLEKRYAAADSQMIKYVETVERVRGGLATVTVSLEGQEEALARLQEPTQTYQEKLRDMALQMPGLADAFNEWAGGIDTTSGSLQAAQPISERTEGLIGAINSQIERLGPRHDWILNLDVQGLGSLQAAIQAASTFGGLEVDPYATTEAGSQGSDPYGGLSGEAVDQSHGSSNPTAVQQAGDNTYQHGGVYNRPMGQAGWALLHGQEEVLTPHDPRHRRNMGMASVGGGDTINIYTMDRSDQVVRQMQRRQRERRYAGL